MSESLQFRRVVFWISAEGEAKMLPGMRNLNGKEGLTVLLYPSKQLGSQDHQKLLKSKKNTARLRIKQLVATCLLKATQLQLSSFTRVQLFAKKVDATNLLAMVIITI